VSHECQTTYEVPTISFIPDVPLEGTARIYSREGAAYALFPDDTEVKLTIGTESTLHDNWFSLSK